mgnify:CR=1 FL=1
MLSLQKTEFTREEVFTVINTDSGKTVRDIFFSDTDERLLTADKLVEEGYDDESANLQFKKNLDNIQLANIIQLAGGNEKNYETLLNKCFSFNHTLFGSSFHRDCLSNPCPTATNMETDVIHGFSTAGSENYLYSSGSYMIIFPESGIRISASSDFIANIPYLKNISDGNFKETTTSLPVELCINNKSGGFDDDSAVYVEGPTIYVCHAPMDMIIYDGWDTSHVPVSLHHHVLRLLDYYNN